ncbi:N-acetylglucosamine-6-phosphate deacetylase [Holdemania massiliensis]|uniref:N-acetylglucosamine-6-phosphate deacetylase n=1 Tax=Holdemania massiliensis TaxID=1468449 RepID=UPI0002FD64BB|nr:N-acetylglucosamine-6-phosphate deacetylase [Holdemania massiliensis]
MIIQSTQVWINDAFQPGQLEIAGGRIEAVLPYGEKPVDQDYQDQWILPGFIDIHTHGWNRCDAGKPTVEAMLRWQKHMPKEGVTSFLATTATQSAAANEAALPILKEAIEAQAAGAEILGINMEGNFISHQFHGAQDLYTIVKPDSQQLLHYQNLAGGHILTVTCAVEFDEDYAFVKTAVAHGIRVSCGHSGASFDQVREAARCGATGITHCGNGMRPFHHRNPGIFGAVLNLEELYAEVIGDGVHVHFETVHLIGTMKGAEKLILVTDSADCKDDPDYAQFAHEGAFRLPDGTLFGSALYVNQGIDHLHRQARLPLVTAIRAATINPALYLGLDGRKGTLEAGKDADIVVCDEHIALQAVYCRGQLQSISE